MNKIGYEVFTRLNKQMAKDSNIFISPFSIVSALTMLISGFDPKSQTYQELRKVLNQNGWKEEEVEDLMMKTIPFAQQSIRCHFFGHQFGLEFGSSSFLFPTFTKILFC